MNTPFVCLVVLRDSSSTDTSRMTEETLKRLSNAPSDRQNSLFNLLIASSSPEEILRAAFHVYDETYRENVLLLAVAALEQFGAHAWSALRAVTVLNRAECEYFVRLIAECPDVSEREKTSAMGNLARNPYPEVRRSILEYASRFSQTSQVAIAQCLKDDPDDEIREQACELLEC